MQDLDDFLQIHQPRELRALREHALTWMDRLALFRPHLTHDVWEGTATSDSDIWLSLFCDDSKSAELALINQGQDYEVGQTRGLNRQTVDVLSIHSLCPGLGQDGKALEIGVHLVMYDYDDLRGALTKGKRGDAAAVRVLMQSHDL